MFVVLLYQKEQERSGLSKSHWFEEGERTGLSSFSWIFQNRFSNFCTWCIIDFQFFQMVQNRFSIFPNDAESVCDRSDLWESIMLPLEVEGELILPCVRKMLDYLMFFIFIFLDWILGLLSHLGCASLFLFITLFLLLLSSPLHPSSKFLIFFLNVFRVFFYVRLLSLIFKMYLHFFSIYLLFLFLMNIFILFYMCLLFSLFFFTVLD